MNPDVLTIFLLFQCSQCFATIAELRPHVCPNSSRQQLTDKSSNSSFNNLISKIPIGSDGMLCYNGHSVTQNGQNGGTHNTEFNTRNFVKKISHNTVFSNKFLGGF